MTKRVAIFAITFALFLAGSASAQWRGLGRVSGTVVDETGAPVPAATVRADLLGIGGTVVQTNEKGEWIVSGIAKGDWQITIAKEGMALQRAKVNVREMGAATAIKTILKKE